MSFHNSIKKLCSIALLIGLYNNTAVCMQSPKCYKYEKWALYSSGQCVAFSIAGGIAGGCIGAAVGALSGLIKGTKTGALGGYHLASRSSHSASTLPIAIMLGAAQGGGMGAAYRAFVVGRLGLSCGTLLGFVYALWKSYKVFPQ